MDPLSQVLDLLQVKAARCTRFEASGAWAFRFPAKPALKFGAVLKGACWMDFGDGRRQLHAGDCFLLANAPAYVLANDDQVAPRDGIAMFDWAHGDLARHQGDDTVLVAGSFSFDSGDAGLLLDALPPFLRIPAAHPSAPLIDLTVRTLAPELTGGAIGATALADRLVDVLLILVLRAAVEQGESGAFGWLGALADPRIGKALRLMHGDPAHGWQLEALAAAVAMSRSAFCQRFRLLIGQSPLDYLVRWRMRLARARLAGGATVAAAAALSGYASESAFGHAFKRVYGRAPSRWRGQDTGA